MKLFQMMKNKSSDATTILIKALLITTFHITLKIATLNICFYLLFVGKVIYKSNQL
jgi:hypothetical protein